MMFKHEGNDRHTRLTMPDTEPFAIAELECASGRIGLARLPGRAGDLAGDVARIAGWGARLVVSLTEKREMAEKGAGALPEMLHTREIAHAAFAIADFGTPDARADWPGLAREIHRRLAAGERVLIHCMGGKGRSGMVAMRLLVENGAAPAEALALVRLARPGAIETEAQAAWASREAK